jgi:hypothetical protein
MTKISNKKLIKKKIPLVSDTFFGGDNEDDGNIVRYDMEDVAALINALNQNAPTPPTPIIINSYFPSGW